MKHFDFTSSRREFLGALAATTTGVLAAASATGATPLPGDSNVAEAENWMKKIKGKHRIIFDGSEPHDGFPVIWAWAFYNTNNQTGTPDADLTALVVLRHGAIPLAMENRLWEKYKFGEAFKITDKNTGAPALRNVFYEPQGKDFPMAQIDGIKKMQARGAMFCVCDLALTVYSSFIAQAAGLNPEEVKKDWVSGLLPGIQVVPSGVWAVGRAQEKDCAYCYAGG
jgi:hypothetical protein